MAVQLVIIITLNMEKFGRQIVLNPNYEMAITFESYYLGLKPTSALFGNWNHSILPSTSQNIY